MPRGIQTPNEQKEIAIKLRCENRLSLSAISKTTGIPRPTLSIILRDHKLTKDETFRILSNHARHQFPKKDRGNESKWHRAVTESGRALTRSDKGKIAEAAIIFRLAIHGLTPYASVFDGDKIDWIVEVPGSRRLVKLQARWARSEPHGLPTIALFCSDGRKGRKRYCDADFDFIVGYDLFSDTAYVYSRTELQHHKSRVAITSAAAEKWDKILG